jgi:hypothetical protein
LISFDSLRVSSRYDFSNYISINLAMTSTQAELNIIIRQKPATAKYLMFGSQSHSFPIKYYFKFVFG